MISRLTMRRSSVLFVVLIAQLAAALTAHADVGYDAISNINPPAILTQSAANWLADDVYLAPGSSQILTRIDIRTRMSSSAPQPSYTGILRLAVFSQQVVFPSGVTPGELLWQGDISTSWTRGQNSDLFAALPNVFAGGNSFWVGWEFLNSGGSPINGSANGLFVMQNMAGPALGVTTSDYANTQSLPTWSVLNSPNTYTFALRVGTIPTPGAAMVLIAAAGLFTRRRR